MHKVGAASVGMPFGGLFVMSAVVVLFRLAPLPETPPETPAGHFFAAFGPTGHLTFVKVLELVGGVLVMVPRFRALGLVILAPIVVNILAFNVFVAGGFTTLAQPMLLAPVVLGRPDAFVVSRSATIPVPAGRLFALVNDLHAWDEWSPWAKLDPVATNTFTGPDAGVGAFTAWSGNAKVGVGRMTIVESRPDTVIRLRLEFEKPMKATNISTFTFLPDGHGTHVTWTMSGTNDLAGKVFGTLVDCDRMVGTQFEKALADLERPGEFQRMSAGTGIRHSEFNPSASEPVHLYQIWLLPERTGIEPGYGQKRFPEHERSDRLRLVASRDAAEGSLTIHQDARIYLASMEPSAEITHAVQAGRHAWVQVLRGVVSLGQHELQAGDGAALSEQLELLLKARDAAEVMLFDVA